MGSENSKIAIIMRGFPGSGKSSFVGKILRGIKGLVVHAVDELHVDDDGNFNWKEDDTERNYELNYANFVRSCSKEKEVVVCDCINLSTREVQRYVSIAEQFDYHVYVVTASPKTSRELARLNKHNVSLIHIREMMSRWEHWPTSPMLEKLSKD
jgi:predicted kinase